MYLVKLNQNDCKKLQNRAARIILNVSNDVEHNIALRALGWEPLQMERKKAKAKIMYKLLNKMGPKSLTNVNPRRIHETSEPTLQAVKFVFKARNRSNQHTMVPIKN